MNLQKQKLLDQIGRKILAVLQKNARTPLSRIGDKVGLSAPAVAERVKKLEEAGIIKGYHARIDPLAFGQSIAAFIHLTTDAKNYPAVKSMAREVTQIDACHHISGEASFILHVCTSNLVELESVVGKLSPYGQTQTFIVLSSPVEKQVRVPL